MLQRNTSCQSEIPAVEQTAKLNTLMTLKLAVSQNQHRKKSSVPVLRKQAAWRLKGEIED